MTFDRITVNPNQMNGQPCIRGVRLTVRRAVEIAANYPDRAKLRLDFSEIEDEDIRQALLFAAANLEVAPPENPWLTLAGTLDPGDPLVQEWKNSWRPTGAK